MNRMGLVAAGATFCGIWFGHVSVRWIEYHAPMLWLPRTIALLLGLGLALAALLNENRALSGALGILAMTLFFDAVELSRQYRRVAKGHAPANPDNPRHRPLLADGRATTTHWLDRDPIGRPVTEGEALRLLQPSQGER